jgi:hypothetical protein
MNLNYSPTTRKAILIEMKYFMARCLIQEKTILFGADLYSYIDQPSKVINSITFNGQI